MKELSAYRDLRVVVTGASGFLASNLVKLLQDVDCRIVRLTRSSTSLRRSKGVARIEDLVADITERRTWESVVGETDFVFHLAAQTSVYRAAEDAVADWHANVLPMVHLLECCRRSNRPPVALFASTVTIAGIPDRLPVDECHPDNPITLYDLHKLMAEQYLGFATRSGIVKGVSLRLANVYGPGPASSSPDRGVINQMIRRALRGEPLTVYGTGDQVRDYVYVEDVARAFLLAGLQADRLKGRHLVVSTGQAHTIAEAVQCVADRVAARMGKRVSIQRVEPPATLSPIEVRNFVGNSHKLREATGWQPKYTLIEGIDRTIEAYL